MTSISDDAEMMSLCCASSVVLPWRIFYLSASTSADAQDWIDLIGWKITRKFV